MVTVTVSTVIVRCRRTFRTDKQQTHIAIQTCDSNFRFLGFFSDSFANLLDSLRLFLKTLDTIWYFGGDFTFYLRFLEIQSIYLRYFNIWCNFPGLWILHDFSRILIDLIGISFLMSSSLICFYLNSYRLLSVKVFLDSLRFLGILLLLHIVHLFLLIFVVCYSI